MNAIVAEGLSAGYTSSAVRRRAGAREISSNSSRSQIWVAFLLGIFAPLGVWRYRSMSR